MAREPPSIGGPIAGSLAEVVDENLQPVAPGETESWCSAASPIARGYLNRPELTAERFLHRPNGRWYRTGDRVRAASRRRDSSSSGASTTS